MMSSARFNGSYPFAYMEFFEPGFPIKIKVKSLHLKGSEEYARNCEVVITKRDGGRKIPVIIERDCFIFPELIKLRDDEELSLKRF